MSERRSFARTAVSGVGTVLVAALSDSRTWLHVSGPAVGERGAASVTADVSGSTVAPLAGALALVALAAWGALLVTRGMARRVFAVLGCVAAVGSAVAVVAGALAPHGIAVAAIQGQGGTVVTDTTRTGWLYLGGVLIVAGAALLAIAVRDAPGWPAMGSRYDAPTAAASGAAAPAPPPRGDEPLTERELWSALDAGQDPTVVGSAGPDNAAAQAGPTAITSKSTDAQTEAEAGPGPSAASPHRPRP